MIAGIKVSMAGKEWEIPPLSFGAVERFTLDGTFKKVDAVMDASGSGPSDVEKLIAIAAVVHAALARNYPEVTLEQVKEMLDERSAPAALLAVRGATFRPRKEEAKGE